MDKIFFSFLLPLNLMWYAAADAAYQSALTSAPWNQSAPKNVPVAAAAAMQCDFKHSSEKEKEHASHVRSIAAPTPKKSPFPWDNVELISATDPLVKAEFDRYVHDGIVTTEDSPLQAMSAIVQHIKSDIKETKNLEKIDYCRRNLFHIASAARCSLRSRLSGYLKKAEDQYFSKADQYFEKHGNKSGGIKPRFLCGLLSLPKEAREFYLKVNSNHLRQRKQVNPEAVRQSIEEEALHQSIKEGTTLFEQFAKGEEPPSKLLERRFQKIEAAVKNRNKPLADGSKREQSPVVPLVETLENTVSLATREYDGSLEGDVDCYALGVAAHNAAEDLNTTVRNIKKSEREQKERDQREAELKEEQRLEEEWRKEQEAQEEPAQILAEKEAQAAVQQAAAQKRLRSASEKLDEQPATPLKYALYCDNSSAFNSALATAPWLDEERKKKEAREIKEAAQLKEAAELNLFDPRRVPIDSEDKKFWEEHEEYENKLTLEIQRLERVAEKADRDALLAMPAQRSSSKQEEKELAAAKNLKKKKKIKWYV